MGERTIHPWTNLCCSQCGFEEQATRAHSQRIDPETWLCSGCELTKPLEEEVARLTAELERRSDRIQELERELGCGCCNTDSPPCGCCPCVRHSDNPPDDWSEADQLRAEVERLRDLAVRRRRLLSRILPLLRRFGVPASKLASETEDAIALHDDALAREDGAG